MVASGEVVIAIGGEWGTLSEIGHARAIGRTVVTLRSWELSGRERMGGAPGVVPAESAEPRPSPLRSPPVDVAVVAVMRQMQLAFDRSLSGEARLGAGPPKMGSMYEESIRDEFTHQTDAFASAAVMSAAETLGALVELVPADPEARWVEVACGPAAISRALAGRVGSVHGVDLTPAMVEKAAAEAAREGIGNAEFSVGDATALGFDDASFDGAVTRFSLHHIPAPKRVLAEMARVVRPGGWVIVGDHVTDADGDAAAWHEEIERLRDPSHWACLTPDRLRAMGEEVGLASRPRGADPLRPRLRRVAGAGLRRSRGGGADRPSPGRSTADSRQLPRRRRGRGAPPGAAQLTHPLAP